jgi:hypothetical protein
MTTYPHWSRKMRWHIPQDWNGIDWDCCLLFYPDSPDWKAIVRGHLQSIVRGWNWDETTGSVKDVQAIARLIPLTFDPTAETRQIPEVAEIMSCLDQIAEDVAAIRAALESEAEWQSQLTALKVAIGVLEPGALPLLALLEETNKAVGTQHLLGSGE